MRVSSASGTSTAAPMTGPHSVPTPPITATSTTRMERSRARSASGSMSSTYCVLNVPAMDIRAPESMNANTL